MQKLQAGFTLIELMIVVAILGILSAVAIPVYQGNVGKTQMYRVVGELGNYRTAYEASLHSSAPITNDTLGYIPSELTTGDFSTQIAVVNADGTGHIEVTMGGKVRAGLSGVIVRFERSSIGLWNCIIDPSQASSWSDSYAPDNCTVI
ncbi:pilin [Marinobacter sp. MA]|uniref:pilin n=1 Tax=Marinobacter sp. MA TaxID=2971606 RepID=UPI003AAAB360